MRGREVFGDSALPVQRGDNQGSHVSFSFRVSDLEKDNAANKRFVNALFRETTIFRTDVRRLVNDYRDVKDKFEKMAGYLALISEKVEYWEEESNVEDKDDRDFEVPNGAGD